MRRSRRGSRSSAMEFGSSGEDSFVAVVVTKLTGALLFILLLTMVIMALIPRGAENPSAPRDRTQARLEIATPERLPEAIAGRPYQLALAAKGGEGPVKWSLSGELPKGVEFDAPSGQLRGQPESGTPEPATLILRASDGAHAASRTVALTVLEPDQPLTVPARWKPSIPPLPWREWLRHGFGFLVLLLVYLVSMNALTNVQRWSRRRHDRDDPASQNRTTRRFARYRWTVRLATAGMMAGLAVWLLRAQ